MPLREERNEQNEQTRRAHFERERLDLSASVEAALMDDGVLSQQWQDELDEQDASQPVTGGAELVPPRLSLQSRTLPAVQPENTISTATDSQQVISSYTMEEVEEKAAPSPQHSGILARLAQRFTSSFAAVKLDMPHQQATLPPQNSEAYHPHLPARSQFSTSPIQPNAPLVRVIDTVVPSETGEERTSTESKRRRSLRRNAKVRLETTELPAIAKPVSLPRLEEQETGEALLSDVRDALSQQQVVPVLPLQREEPIVRQYSALPSTRSPLSGSGTFESEHSDISIINSCITASSVVLVTLTTNPGPVVVQYISLQPEVGFTIHLTAPVTIRTTFNYLILLGETV